LDSISIANLVGLAIFFGLVDLAAIGDGNEINACRSMKDRGATV
jgi:hypothetical protein